MLLSMKSGDKSFSEVIKGMAPKKDNKNIMKYFGALKGDKNVQKVKKLIQEERRSNMGRIIE